MVVDQLRKRSTGKHGLTGALLLIMVRVAHSGEPH
jgi:hypothetical protein